jgi:hypothetical protein
VDLDFLKKLDQFFAYFSKTTFTQEMKMSNIASQQTCGNTQPKPVATGGCCGGGCVVPTTQPVPPTPVDCGGTSQTPNETGCGEPTHEPDSQ